MHGLTTWRAACAWAGQMNTMNRTFTLLASLALAAPLAVAQEFTQLRVERLDPPSDVERRKLTLAIDGRDGHVDATEERPVERDGQTAWEARVHGRSRLTRRRLGELSAQVRDALAAGPSGNLSSALSREETAAARRHRVTIDGTSFDVYAGRLDGAAADAVGPLLATLEALIEKQLPPPAFYQRLVYRRPGAPARVLEISPTGNASLETAGAPFLFKTLSAGPLQKIDGLARAAGPFVAANQGRSLALPAAPAAAGGERFELELVLRGGGEPVKVSGTVGSYAASAARTGELVDYLEATLARLGRGNAPSGGLSGAVDPD